MKNKEIEELLNKMKNCNGIFDYYLEYGEVDLLLSYIEQLETDYKEANESVTWWQNRYDAIVKQNDDNHKKIVKLENNRDKVIEYIDITIELIEQQPTEHDTWILDRLKGFKNILKGDSDE